MEVFDVIIVGAGPAGGSAALRAAGHGLSTLVLEEHEKIGEPVHCGECLSQVALNKLPLTPAPEAISMQVKGVRVIFPDGSSNYVSEPGVVLEKHKFEQWIMREAEAKGAQVKLGYRVTDVKRENGIWSVVTEKETFAAKMLIDASGVASIISAKINLNQRFKSVIGIQYELEDIPQDGWLDFYLWPELAPHGYLWMIPKSNGRANVGLVTNQNNKAKEFNDLFVKRMGWEGKKILKTFGGLIPASGPVEHTYSDGLLLIGDAAGFTSPLFEGGTHLSIQSGWFAADVTAKALSENNLSQERLSEYEKLWKAEFPPYATLVEGKDTIYGFTDSELNEISRLMPQQLGKIPPLAKLIVGIKLLTKPHLVKKGVMKAFAAFRYSRASRYGW